MKSIAAAIACSLFAVSLWAQLNTGRISGTITDQSGGAIAGAMVTIVDVARGDSRPLISDASGLYAAPNLTPGTYTVRTEFMGFETVERQNIEVGVGGDVRVDVTLPPGAQTQTVTVTESLPIVNTTNAETGGTVDTQAISQLPVNGRNYRRLIMFVPGVVEGVGEGSSNTYVNGTPLNNGMFNIMLDGLYTEAVFTLDFNVGGSGEGGDNTLMPLDAIQEVNEVINPKAEYGWAPGVTEDIGLKSGTNELHGSAYAFGRDTSLDARDPFAFNTVTGAPTKSPVNLEQFGATLGGPIKKNKLFYFLGYESQRLSVESSFTVKDPTLQDLGAGSSANSIPEAIAAINGVNPKLLSQLSANLVGCNWNNAGIHSTTAANVVSACQNSNQFGASDLFGNLSSTTTVSENFPNYGGSNNGLAKIDYHINDHHSLTGDFYIGNYSEYVVPVSSQNFTQPYWEELTAVITRDGRLAEIWAPNSNIVNQARVGIDHASRPTLRGECTNNFSLNNPAGIGAPSGGAVGGVAGPNYLTQYGLYSGSPGCGIPTISISGFSGKLGFGNDRMDWENPIQGADTLSYTRGVHDFKFGVDVRAEHFTGAKTLDSQVGSIAFGTSGYPSAFIGANALEDFLSGDPATEAIRTASNIRNITTNKIGVFAQDDWRIKPRLTLNLGFRWEVETPARDASGLMGNFAPGTPTGMIQNNQIWKLQSDYEPRIGFSYDVTGKGTTSVRGGFTSMYMIPALINFVAAGGNLGAGEDYGSEATGATLFNASGVCVQGTLAGCEHVPVGNINSEYVAPFATATTSLPWAASTGTGNNALFPATTLVSQCGNGQPIATGSTTINPAPCIGTGGDPNLKLFPFYSWNLNVQHAFTNKVSLDVGYVGSHASDIYEAYDINQPTPGCAAPSCLTGPPTGTQELESRPNYAAYPWFSFIDYYANLGSSNYAALQMNLIAQNVHGLTLRANYTLSHGLTQGPVTDSLDPKLDYGTNVLDSLHHLTLGGTYAIPGIKAPGQALQGWAVDVTMNIMSALPVNVVDSSTDDVAGTGDPAHWTLYGPTKPFNQIFGGAGNIPCYATTGAKFAGAPCITVSSGPVGTPWANLPAACIAAAQSEAPSPGSTGTTTQLTQLNRIGCYMVNGSAIVPPAQGTYGNMTYDELRGKGYGLLNTALTKEWKFKERLTTQFRFEVYNIFNRAQYAAPGVNPAVPTSFGLATVTPDENHGNPILGTGGPREMQLALKILW